MGNEERREQGMVTRRSFVLRGGLPGLALALGVAPPARAAAAPSAPQSRSTPPALAAHGPGPVDVRLRVNGRVHAVRIEPRVTLLDALRERLALTGTKKGCDQGTCGACTVLIDGRRIVSCLTLAVMQQEREITTVEGLAQGDRLHPLQAAFIERDGFQCGYCTPGQIVSAVALLQEARRGAPSAATADLQREGAVALTRDEIRERMSGNICRCGAYPNIVDAILDVAAGDGHATV